MTTDNKTLAVDVLAVLNKCHDALECGGLRHVLAESITAFAELIESCDHLKRDATNERWAAFHAALARVKGESA